MSDFILELSQNPTTNRLIKTLGLPIPQPTPLKRTRGAYEAHALAGKKSLVGAVPNGFATNTMLKVIADMGADLLISGYNEQTPSLVAASEKAGSPAMVLAPHAVPKGLKADSLVFDATGVTSTADLKALYQFFHPWMRKINAHGRIVVLARVPELEKDLKTSVCARAIEGFVRSAGKEVGGKGATANLIYVEKGAEAKIEGPLRFFLSTRSAFVSGQNMRVTKAVKAPADIPYTDVLKGKIALVTGAARGIGEATAVRLAAEGAHVVCLDVPFDLDTLNATTAKVGGTALPLDITDDNAPRVIADFLNEKFGGVDIVVHNAGVTRDKRLQNMKEHLWDMVIAINMQAIFDIDEVLLSEGLIRKDGRVVTIASVAGIAGNGGQTNYGLTKAGMIGYAQAQSKAQAKNGITFNAVGPGFIETRMTAAMPFGLREGARRLSSLSQGGQPEDVAELITFFSTPGSVGVTGNLVRVCGQAMIGA